MSTVGHSKTYRNKWLEGGVYVVSIILAGLLMFALLPADYHSGGGTVAVMIAGYALILRFLFWLTLGRIIAKHENK